jgi:chromosome partitioning protein
MISPAHIIVFWNIKSGSGTSTTAMHVAIGLLRLGYKVGSIDLDARQSTLTRYLTNRIYYSPASPSPAHLSIEDNQDNLLNHNNKKTYDFLLTALEKLRPDFDFIIIDTPCPGEILSHPVHSYSDTLITPLNGAQTDLDSIARVVHGQNGIQTDWVVLRNRISPADTSADTLDRLSGTLGFRLVPGFNERDIFPALFLKGLTLLDLKEDPDSPITLSTLTARQEVRQVLRSLNPQKLKGYPQIRNIRK